MKTKIFLTLLPCLGLIFAQAFGQLVVAPNQSAATLAAQLVGPGVTVSNPVLNCPGPANGLFGGGNSANVGINTGIMLTSGGVAGVPGTNNLGNYGVDNGAPGDPQLTALSGFTTLDRCVLEFDFEAIANSVSIRYVFGSDEYLEYVNTSYNDVFAFLVTGPNPAGGNYNNVNIATVPNSNAAVTINTINHLVNTGYFVNNPQGPATLIEYDGYTVVLTASIDIVPCELYHFKLAIADATDRNFDSGVFLEEASFEATLVCRDVTLSLGEDGTGSVTAEDLIASDLDACDFSYAVSQSEFVCSDAGVNTVTVTATDPDGNVLECEATVTVVVPEGIIDVDLGPACRPVYYGYAPASCTDITASASGGTPPYSYAWSNGETTETISVCPDASTSYSVVVTDANGCSEIGGPVDVRVVDVRCGNNGSKVLVCHLPPGNPENAQSICIAASAVPAHLAHGDFLGDCSGLADPCAEEYAEYAGIVQAVRPDAIDVEPLLWPNPGQDRLVVNLPELIDSPARVQLVGRNGDVVRRMILPAGAISGEFTDLANLPGGAYTIRITDGEGSIWTLKWMKLD